MSRLARPDRRAFALRNSTGIAPRARLAFSSRIAQIERGGRRLSEARERTAGRSKRLAWVTAAILFGLAAVAAPGSVLKVTAAPAISVFVGYADSARAGGEFPNPWNGAPHITFDACSPQASCIFDGGAMRVRNDAATSVSIDHISAHIGSCVYTWSGSMYPVVLPPGESLVTAQRGSGVSAGCTGPDPVSFDSSDIPSVGTCINDGIQPTVDVSVDGTTNTFVDSGQVLNTGGIDPGACTNTDESTQWVRIGSKPCPGEALALAPPSQVDPVGSTAAVSATFTNGCGAPLGDVVIGFRVVSGPNSGTTGSGTTDAAGNATFTYSSSVTGTDSLQAAVTNAVGFTKTSNTATVTWTIEFAPGGGSFVIGNSNDILGNTVNFWGSQWAKHNSLTGGPAPRSFKGFADQPPTPACGQRWTAEPGNSTPPPDGPLPSLMAVIVTSAATKQGPELSGDIVAIVVVKTDPGYEPNPGHAATGTVVAVVCAVASAATTASTQTQGHGAQAPTASPARVGPGGGSPPAACQVVTHGKSAHHSRRNSCPRSKQH